MISLLKINNFKSINKLKIKFKNLNILCGENASGKTSIIHSILLCSQNNKNNKSVDGEIIKIGDYKELKNNSIDSEIKITIKNKNATKSIIYKRNDNPKLNQNDILFVDNKKNDCFMFEKSIFYLSSNRTGVMDTYKKGNYLFGTDGAETISFLYNHQDDFMTLEYMEYFNKIKKNAPIKENRKFIEHVRFWMEFITDETIFISSIDKTNQYILAYGDSKIRPINTGSGYSFLLPIVIACLGTVLLGEDTPTIIIENPEIFLHPEAQKKLMKFLIFCKKFVQIIIETHSEHIIQNTIENSKSDTQILVAEKKNNFTNILTFNGKDFKTNSYLEVIYRAFGVIVPEFHILLYGLVQQQYNVSSNIFESRIKDFDDYLKGLNGICLKKWKHENKDKNGYVTSITTYETLPTFIRNKIDHPEAKNPDTNKIYNYTYSEIEKSIEFLLNII